MPQSPDRGSLLGCRLGHYEIVSPLGAGGMGEVYLAQDTRLDRRVALKLLPESLTSDAEATRRFLREARTAAALDHPNICAIHEIGEVGGRSFIVMQYIEGENLAARIARARPTAAESLALAQQIAEALAEAHAHQIIHRDIKPANVVVTPRGQAKVLDFGLAKTVPAGLVDTQIATASLLSTPGLVVGTAPYMSPEQVRGEAVDARTDVWSFGVLLHELLTGSRPFEAKTSVEIMSAILTRDPPPLGDPTTRSSRLERVVRRCLEKDRALRYPTMRELIADLATARRELDEGPIESSIAAAAVVARAESPPAPTVSPAAQRHSGAPFKLFAVGAVIVLAAAYFVFSQRGEAPPPTGGAEHIAAAARDEYLRGKVLTSEENRQSAEQAIEHLERAVAADPGFAPAFAELARAYYNKAFYYSPEQAKQMHIEAKLALEKALAIDPDLPYAHYVRGLLLWSKVNRFPHAQAIRSLRRALELDPALSEAHHALGMVYIHVGLLDLGRDAVEQALSINPADTLARYRLAVIHLYSGEYEDALDALQSIPQDVNPSLVDRTLAQTYLHLGRLEEAATVMDSYFRSNARDEGGSLTATQALLFAKRGEAREAEASIRRAIEIGEGYGHFHHTAHNVAAAFALLGKPDEAIRWLKLAAEDGFPCRPCYETDRFLGALAGDERFLELMAKLGEQEKRYASPE